MKNIINRNIVVWFAGLLLLSGGISCSDDWLSLSDPNRYTVDNYWQTENDFESGLAAAYRYQRQSEGGFARWYHQINVLRSDEGYSTSPNTIIPSYGNFLHSPYIANNSTAYAYPWRDAYTQIYFANQVLDALNEKGEAVLAGDRFNEIKGQALFIRASAYWWMASLYGQSVKQTTASTSDGIGDGIMNQYDSYMFALKDFEAASALLPVTWPEADLGRVTKGGAYGMMCRINMQLAGYCKRPSSVDAMAASHSSEATAFWTAAKKNCEDIFALGIYSLVPDYVDNFTSRNEFNSESIFELPYKYTGTNSYMGDYSGLHRPQYLGLYLASSGGAAWDDVSPRQWLLDEFDLEPDKDGKVDIRKHYTLFYEDPDYVDEILYHGKNWAQLDSINHFAKPCYWRKYSQVDSKTGYTERYSSDINYRMIRLAEVYLNYAEILNELGTDRSTAVEYINKVRRRVNMTDLNASDFGSYDLLLARIKHERVMELCGECLRFNDLDRWGDIYTQAGVNALAERDEDFLTYTIGTSHLFPIPQREISYYPGLDQNPGY